MIILRCLKCEYKWMPRVERPSHCPNCHTNNWDCAFYSKCKACSRNFRNMHIHHIDGNNKNNKKENRIQICLDCHMVIHHTPDWQAEGKRVRKYTFEPEAEKKLKILKSRLRKGGKEEHGKN